MAKTVAQNASSSVAGMRSASRSRPAGGTGRRRRNCPARRCRDSARTAPARGRRGRAIGASAARSAAGVSIETIWLTGIADEAEHREGDDADREHDADGLQGAAKMKASIASTILECASADVAVSRKRKGPGAVTLPGPRDQPPLFLLGRPVEQDLVVGALDQLDLLGHAPGQRLLVQRDVGPVLRCRSRRPP